MCYVSCSWDSDRKRREGRKEEAKDRNGTGRDVTAENVLLHILFLGWFTFLNGGYSGGLFNSSGCPRREISCSWTVLVTHQNGEEEEDEDEMMRMGTDSCATCDVIRLISSFRDNSVVQGRDLSSFLRGTRLGKEGGD